MLKISSKCALGILLFSVAAQASVPASSAAPYKILLTSFDPFGGSSANNSQPIVAQLAKLASTLGPNVSVVTCNLPVVYDQGAQTAENCIQKYQPSAVISFGEADCSLQIETAANNLDDTPGAPDNAGDIRTNAVIVPGAPDRNGFDFPVQAMFCALNSSSMPVDVSMSPGNFVCNNVAYHLSYDLNKKGIPFTFIHVPNSQCSGSQKNPAKNAKTVAQMLKAALADLRAETATNTLFPHPGNGILMPTTADQVSTLFSKAPSGSCEQSFLNQLSSAYQSGM